MRTPRRKECKLSVDEEATDLSRFRPYLLILARLRLDDSLRSKVDGSDVVQQTLLEAFEALNDFRGTTELETAAWLRKILARNLADEVRKFRRQKRDVGLEASLQAALDESSARLEDWLACEQRGPTQHAMANEELVFLAEALMELPEDQRRAVELHHLQGLRSVEVAKRMEKTEVAVSGLLRRGLKRLRELMRPKE